MCSRTSAQDFISNKFFAIHWEFPGVCERFAELSHLRMWLLIKTTPNIPTVCIIKCFVNYAITAISHLIGSTRKRNLWHVYYRIYTHPLMQICALFKHCVFMIGFYSWKLKYFIFNEFKSEWMFVFLEQQSTTYNLENCLNQN